MRLFSLVGVTVVAVLQHATSTPGMLSDADLLDGSFADLKSMDLNNDNILDPSEVEAARLAKAQPQQPESKPALSAAEVQKADSCSAATRFNASATATVALSEQLFTKLRQTTMLIMAEEKAEAAALEALRELQKQAVADLQACDAMKSTAVKEVGFYEQELKDIMHLVNSSGSSFLWQHSLLARKVVSIHQADGVVEEDRAAAQQNHSVHHERVDYAAQRLRLCMQQVQQGLNAFDLDAKQDQESVQQACVEEEEQLHKIYTQAQVTLKDLIQAAHQKGEDACHIAVVSQFEVGRVRLEEEVATSRKRICEALKEASEAEEGLVELQSHLKDADDALGGKCANDQWMVFESGVYILAGLVHSRPNSKAQADACASFLM
mmetsp:Transcript_70661/g.132239  ORF Transcript_70661/g.132239 Transcript_70661/m.132239 type:complete len:379 (+) Transcript_70661:82-1218(+)